MYFVEIYLKFRFDNIFFFFLLFVFEVRGVNIFNLLIN